MKTFRDILDPSRRSEQKQVYTSHILRIFGGASAILLSAILGPAPFWKKAKGFIRAEAVERKRLKQALQRLEKRGLVRRQKRDDGNEYLLLTQAGEKEFLQEKCRVLTLQQPQKWDERWRIVAFDVAEDKKTVRDAIRKHLQKLGFYRLQKSVFAIPLPCEEEIRFLQKFYESRTEICLITALTLGDKESAARKHFGMKK